jgi:5'(3')-deoxyribonucleotidase
VDLDGVGANWQSYVISRHFKGMSIDELNQHPDRLQLLRQMYKREPRLFLNLPVIPQYGQFLDALTARDIPWKILTAAGDDHPVYETVKNDKLLWLKQRFGIEEDRVIITQASSDKHQYAHEQAVLVDDFVSNCRQWEAAGGIAVHVDRVWYCPIGLADQVAAKLPAMA